MAERPGGGTHAPLPLDERGRRTPPWQQEEKPVAVARCFTSGTQRLNEAIRR